MGRGGGVKSPIHLHFVLCAKRGRGVQIACKIAYVLNGRPLRWSVHVVKMWENLPVFRGRYSQIGEIICGQI